jgi:CRISPR/Cas system CSM-associated protein Csm4 (group 5 of RAMP superfamily)
VFISFDYDNDEDLKVLLVGQAKNEDSPFDISDWSIKTASRDWKEQARARIKRAEQVIVICGENTDDATGVDVELKIAQEESKPYFLLKGRSEVECKKPSAALAGDKLYRWTWSNLKNLLSGLR